MSSPKTIPSSEDRCNHRPLTPHPSKKTLNFIGVEGSIVHESFSMSSDKAFNFANVESDCPVDAPSGCIGISLATVVNAFRGPLSSAPQLTSQEEDGITVFNRFRRLRSSVQSSVQRSLSCATSKTVRPNVLDDRHVSFEGCEDDPDPFEREKSLMQRAASWGTQETMNSTLNDNGSHRNVHFHYPPITSVRLRPRTDSDDIKELFFAPEELDEIEDDRSDTRAADDVETLAVGMEDWNAMPTCTSSSEESAVTASYDDGDSRSELPLAGLGASNGMFDLVGSPRKRDSSTERKRIVRGVQIMLREKSTG